MSFNFDDFLGGKLKDLVDFLNENNIKYILVQTKSPKKQEAGKKRVINIKQENDQYIIIWSYQYYE